MIDELLDLYYEINNIYMELFKLELINNKKDVSFYQLVSLLKEKIHNEKRLFEKIDYDLYQKIYDALCSNQDALCMRICDYITLDNALNIDICEDDMEEDIEDKELLMKLGKLYSACSRNIFLVYLSMYQEYIDSNKDIELREKLLNLKYFNSFTKHDMENTLIDCNFNVSRDNYVDVYFVADTLKLNLALCDEIILDCFLSTINLTCMQLLTINDSDYDDKNKIAISINNQCMLRASLALLSERDYEKIKKIVFSKIRKLINDNNKKSLLLISSIFNDRKKDKSRVKKVSIRPICD